VQSFTARMPLLMATSAFGLRRKTLEFSSTALSTLYLYYTHTRLTAFVQDYLGGQVPEGKTNPDFTEERESEWQWHQLGHASLHLTPNR